MYEDRFIQLSVKVEKIILSLITLLFFFLFLVQALLQWEPFRLFFSPVDQMEGKLLQSESVDTLPSWLHQPPDTGE
jgi:hypothetical protein